MKYWRGFLVAAIIGAFTWALNEFAKTHTMLVDMIWPYMTRTYQTYLAEWSSDAAFCIWQTLAIVLLLLVVSTLLLTIILKKSPIQWLGWVTACASLLFFFHTAIYGLNAHAGSISDDIHLAETEYTLAELEDAAIYYRDKANDLATKVKRSGNGDVDFADFDSLAAIASEGYTILVNERSCSVFAGTDVPVKQLGWADMYSSMGITGVTVAMTGEAAVNPQIPAITQPFTMCHELAHRVSIATERDANFAAFLAARFNPDIQFQYSAYYMAFRYCYTALLNVGASSAASRVSAGMNQQLRHDIEQYDEFFASRRDESATLIADTANDAMLKTIGDESGVASYGEVTDLLVCWHIQEVVIPSQQQEEQKFDPYDPNQVDLTGLANAPSEG